MSHVENPHIPMSDSLTLLEQPHTVEEADAVIRRLQAALRHTQKRLDEAAKERDIAFMEGAYFGQGDDNLGRVLYEHDINYPRFHELIYKNDWRVDIDEDTIEEIGDYLYRRYEEEMDDGD